MAAHPPTRPPIHPLTRLPQGRSPFVGRWGRVAAADREGRDGPLGRFGDADGRCVVRNLGDRPARGAEPANGLAAADCGFAGDRRNPDPKCRRASRVPAHLPVVAGAAATGSAAGKQANHVRHLPAHHRHRGTADRDARFAKRSRKRCGAPSLLKSPRAFRSPFHVLCTLL
jgi:hypothetical protein